MSEGGDGGLVRHVGGGIAPVIRWVAVASCSVEDEGASRPPRIIVSDILLISRER